ncbi:MAG: hemerythrin domain-containing protein [Dehalococcoidia bacterium]|nr:hemerythrin domain-containing protein [Dehalococcoidia bacterium]
MARGNSNILSVLREAHRIGLAKLKVLQDSVDDLNAGELYSARARLLEVMPFFEKELPLHFRHEEEVLHPALRRFLAGPGPILIDGFVPDLCILLFCDDLCQRLGPLTMYVRDHQILYECIENLKSIADQSALLTEPNGDWTRQAMHAIASVSWQLGSHIAKENEVLLPKAEEVLSPKVLLKLGRAAENLS